MEKNGSKVVTLVPIGGTYFYFVFVKRIASFTLFYINFFFLTYLGKNSKK